MKKEKTKFKYMIISYRPYETEVWKYTTKKELKKDLKDLYDIKINEIKKYNEETGQYIEIIKIGEIIYD